MESNEFLNSVGATPAGHMDRTEVGRFLIERQDQIRQLLESRTPQRSSGVAATDVVSSVIRRVDAAIERGTFVPQSHDQVWAYASTAARMVTLTKAAMERRFRSLDDGNDGWRDQMLASMEQIEEDRAVDILYTCAASLDERHDRTFFLLLMRGATIASASEAIGWSAENGRRRWMNIKLRLRERFGGKYGPAST